MNCKSMLLMCLIALAPLANAQVQAEGSDYSGRLIEGVWKKSWTTALEQSLASSNLYSHKEKQIENLCPGYGASATKRQLFWQELMIALSWKESLHGATNFIRFNGGTNNGLFQINPALRDAYGCGAVNLFDATSNIRCGVRMAAQLVSQFGTFLSGSKGGMAAYWQPLRATSPGNARNRNYILAETRAACIAGHLNYVSTTHPELVDIPEFNTTDDLGLPAGALNPQDDEIYPALTFGAGGSFRYN